jgi:glycogen synthase kinase 3 beta
MEFKFPQIKGCQWKKIFRNRTPEDAMDFIVANLLTLHPNVYAPEGCTPFLWTRIAQESTILNKVTALYLRSLILTEHELLSVARNCWRNHTTAYKAKEQ